MTEKPTTAEEGDMFIDPFTEKTFYFTNGRWLDITREKEDPRLEESSY